MIKELNNWVYAILDTGDSCKEFIDSRTAVTSSFEFTIGNIDLHTVTLYLSQLQEIIG